MYCAICGAKLKEGTEFCDICGRAVSVHGEERREAQRSEFLKIRKTRENKNPKAAAAFGFFLGWFFLGPLGYVYLEQWNWFWFTFVIQIFAYPLTLFTAYPILPVVYALHQYQMAREINDLVVPRERVSPGGEEWKEASSSDSAQA